MVIYKRKMGEKKIKTLKDIAEELGVSIASVSYVYNNKWKENGLSTSLAERIARKLKEDNYRPNSLGLQLKTKRTQTIGIILEDMTRRFNLDILAGIEKVLATKGYFTLVCSSNLGELEKEQLETLLERNLDGIIFTPQTNEPGTLNIVKEVKERNIPIVLVDNYFPEIKTDFVVSNNYSGAYQAVKYLIKKGKRKIAYIGAKKDITGLRDRFKGYTAALIEADISVNRDLIGEHLPDIFSRDIPDAIFVDSLMYFKEGFRFLSENNYKIPDDILITGFDPVDLSLSEMQNIGFHSLVKQPIPFVEQDGVRMGELAAEIIIKRIKGEKRKKTFSRIFLTPTLKFFN